MTMPKLTESEFTADLGLDPFFRGSREGYLLSEHTTCRVVLLAPDKQVVIQS